jgi:hypothetical protein
MTKYGEDFRRACIKARRVFFLLRTQEFRHTGYELILSWPTNIPSDIVPLIRAHLDVIYRPKMLYRATGVVLSDLWEEGEAQHDLFGEVLRAARIRQVYEAVDQLDAKYGKHTVFLGSSFAVMHGKQHAGDRGELPRRCTMLLKGEGERKRRDTTLGRGAVSTSAQHSALPHRFSVLLRPRHDIL